MIISAREAVPLGSVGIVLSLIFLGFDTQRVGKGMHKARVSQKTAKPYLPPFARHRPCSSNQRENAFALARRQ